MDPDALALIPPEKRDYLFAVAQCAAQNAKDPSKLEELRGWYSGSAFEVPVELRRKTRENMKKLGYGAEQLVPESYDAKSERQSAAGPASYSLFPFHVRPEYRPAWDALLLLPPQMRNTVISDAVKQIHQAESLPIIVEKFRVAAARMRRTGWDEDDNGDFVGLSDAILAIGGERGVEALMECAEVLEADPSYRNGKRSARRAIAIILSRIDPDNKDSGVPLDNKWKEFKSIIEQKLKAPTLTDFRRSILEEAISRMPKK